MATARLVAQAESVARPVRPPSRVARGRLPGAFWIAGAMLVCTTAAEWCITAWGATFVEVCRYCGYRWTGSIPAQSS
jgi:hypothetical protein